MDELPPVEDGKTNSLPIDELPKDWDEYNKKLCEKNLMDMSLAELKDYLDYIIYDKLKNHTYNNPILLDVFKHILVYSRIQDLQTNIISAKADCAQAYIQAIMLYIKDRHPEDMDDLLHVVSEINKERDMVCVKGLPQKEQDSVLQKAQEMIQHNLAMRVNRGER